jgi:hypothetical protein
MNEAGFRYANPFAANDDPRFQTATPTKLEIATATADVRCKRNAAVTTAWLEAETLIQLSQIKRHRTELANHARLITVQTANARLLLAPSP